MSETSEMSGEVRVQAPRDQRAGGDRGAAHALGGCPGPGGGERVSMRARAARGAPAPSRSAERPARRPAAKRRDAGAAPPPLLRPPPAAAEAAASAAGSVGLLRCDGGDCG
ncbi:unnamed protein product, partial [Prorocentrum cordatum]